MTHEVSRLLRTKRLRVFEIGLQTELPDLMIMVEVLDSMSSHLGEDELDKTGVMKRLTKRTKNLFSLSRL